ncbi:unnamed protein product [Anisakis simplex]|uniref:Transmembrane protein n=1 Tax=Anisakis simplex TaxID=6269 RepID=A0A0M3JFU9_ANISI|nr:unnamed protein product [Anisakis simplex]
MEDRILVEVAVTSTTVFVILAYALRYRAALINALFSFIFFIALCVFSMRSQQPISNVPFILWTRLFDGTDSRYVKVFLKAQPVTCSQQFHTPYVNRLSVL